MKINVVEKFLYKKFRVYLVVQCKSKNCTSIKNIGL